MAEYELTREEYEALTVRRGIIRTRWAKGLLRIFWFLLLLGILALIIYFRQWLFGALILGFIAFMIIQERRRDPLGFQHDTFRSGRIKFEVFPDHFRISSGLNIVQFEYSQLMFLLEYPRGFIIAHHSGFRATIPKEALSEAERSTLLALKASFPKIARRMYVESVESRPTTA
jgi:hypothetical protein